MAFRVETSAEAELDAISILEWLLAQHAGDAGLRWFMAMDEAIASLANFPERCTLAPETTRFPFERAGGRHHSQQSRGVPNVTGCRTQQDRPLRTGDSPTRAFGHLAPAFAAQR